MGYRLNVHKGDTVFRADITVSENPEVIVSTGSVLWEDAESVRIFFTVNGWPGRTKIPREAEAYAWRETVEDALCYLRENRAEVLARAEKQLVQFKRHLDLAMAARPEDFPQKNEEE